jgi:hypothetical protein
MTQKLILKLIAVHRGPALKEFKDGIDRDRYIRIKTGPLKGCYLSRLGPTFSLGRTAVIEFKPVIRIGL